MLWTPLPSYNQEDFSQQKSGVVVSGDFSYRDGFDTTTKTDDAILLHRFL